jgi:hypothetical protein
MRVSSGTICLTGQTALPDTRGFAGSTAQVVQPGTTNPAFGHQFDFLDPRIMQGESFLDANPVGDLSDGVSGVHGAAFATNNDTLVNLDPFLVTLDDADMYAYGITGTEMRMVHAHLLEIDSVNYSAHNVLV